MLRIVVRVRLVEHDQLLRFRIRKRPQQQIVRDGIDGHACADPQHQ